MTNYLGNVLVPVEKIPKVADVTDVPTDDPMDIYRICREMEVCCDADQGIGLSAVQVGIPWRLFVIKGDGTSLVSKGQYGYFVNCEYEPVTETEQIVSVEGCLSVRSQEGQLRFFHMERHKSIRLYGFKLEYNIDGIDESGYSSRNGYSSRSSHKLSFKKFDTELGLAEQGVVVQHELDHQRGILISDCGREIFIWK